MVVINIQYLSVPGNYLSVPGNCVRYFALATREDETKIYFTSQNNNIQCISMDGTDICSFTSPGLISPAGLAIDDLGNLFVAGFRSFNIHQLKLDGNDIENTIILKKKKMTLKNPKLYVSTKTDLNFILPSMVENLY